MFSSLDLHDCILDSQSCFELRSNCFDLLLQCRLDSIVALFLLMGGCSHPVLHEQGATDIGAVDDAEVLGHFGGHVRHLHQPLSDPCRLVVIQQKGDTIKTEVQEKEGESEKDKCKSRGLKEW